MRAFISRLINVVLPASCPACQHVLAEAGMCGACWGKLKLIDPPACVQCGKGFAFAESGITRCDRCVAFRHSFDRTAAALAYTAMSKKLILGLKYGDRHDVIPILSQILARRGSTLLAQADFIVPLPLHPWRYLSRGFNQSAELARAVVQVAGIDFSKYRPDILIRQKNTESQGYKMRKERVKNMKGAFRVRDKNKSVLDGKRVLLVDDVMTTGASLSSAAQCLKQGGARQVDSLVVARVG